MGLLGHIGTGNTHGNTNIGLLEGGRVVDTITSDGDNLTSALATIDNDQLLLWRSTSKNNFFVVTENIINVGFGKVTQLGTVNNGGSGLALVNLGDVDSSLLGNVLNGVVTLGDNTDGFSNGFSSDWMITSDHDDF